MTVEDTLTRWETEEAQVRARHSAVPGCALPDPIVGRLLALEQSGDESQRSDRYST